MAAPPDELAPDPHDAFRDDLFDTIGDAHYLLPPALAAHDDDLLESLVEKGCEDNQILDRLSAQLAGEPFGGEPPPAARAPSPESPSRSAAQGLLHLARPEPAPDDLLYRAPPEPPPAPPEEPPPSPGLAPPAAARAGPDEPLESKIELDAGDLGDIKLDMDALAADLTLGFKLEAEAELERLSRELEEPTDLSLAAGDEPRDLSLPRREPPRAPSRESDAMQSPQPSGIPAVSSPEVFAAPPARCRPSPFLESLYASTSPKMYTSEVSIQQCAPLNLGKHRKSASPTVSSCSDDVRAPREPAEPPEKRARRESHDLAKICSLLKKSGEERLAEAKHRKRLSEIERLPPLKQLELLESNKNFNLPERMLVPRERLGNIIAAPGREIPALLVERPQLNAPDLLHDPACIGDPDLMVISLEQIRQLIIHKPAAAPAAPAAPPPRAEPAPRALLADELDAAGAAAYQMNWLPAMYLSQMEAMAACSQNAEFLKALGSSGYPGAGYAGLPPAFHPRYGMPAAPAVPPLEFAMWQEAMSAMQRQRRMEAKEADPYAKARRTARSPPAPAGARGPPRAPAGSPRPRISVKSLQELQQAQARRPPPARRRDEPEVGSTTSAGEPQPPPPPHPHQHPHPHDPAAFSLWHPLFSNQKGYPSPWSWTTVTATGD